jgi:hypothetical protein
MNRGIGMLEDAHSQRHVANVIVVSKSVVSRMWNRFQMTGNVLQGHAGGRERSITQLNATDVRVSTQTVRNRLHDAALRSGSRQAIRMSLIQRHIQERLQRAQTHAT